MPSPLHDLKAYVGQFTCPGAGVLTAQTVSGIVDASGNAFTPRLVIFFRYVDTFFSTFTSAAYGVDDGTSAHGHTSTSNWFAGNPWAGYASAWADSIVDSVNVFSARFITQGHITARSSGAFQYTLSVNEFGGSQYGFLALGGADLVYSIGRFSIPGSGSSATFSNVGFEPSGVIYGRAQYNGGSTVTANNWNGTPGFGFCDGDLNQGCASGGIKEPTVPSDAKSYQRTNQAGVECGTSGAPAVTAKDGFTITGWTSTGWTYTYTSDAYNDAWWYCAFGSPMVVSGGSITSPTSDGAAVIAFPAPNLPIAAMVWSTGAAASTSATTNYGFSIGASDGTRQQANWTAALNGVSVAGTGGAAYGVNTDTLFMAAPAATLGAMTEHGRLSLDTFAYATVSGSWSNVDGTQRQALYVVLGGEIEPSVRTTYPTRRVRRFPLPVSEDDKRMVIHKLQFLMQMGVGTIATPSPKVMIRISRDYGKTWGPEMWASPERDYSARVIFRVLGQTRSGGYCEVAVSDPVQWVFLSAIADITEGTS